MNSKMNVLDIKGKKLKEISLPSFFSSPIRKDILSKVLEAKKSMQPYSASPTGGKQHSASGKIVHRRHVWKSGYGRGMSRIPRKVHSKRGSQFNWVGAEVASTRGGRRAHPPKAISMINTNKINKKELRIALISALSATANIKEIASKYENINEKEIKNLPLVVESKIVSLKTKDLLSTLENILGKEVYSTVSKKKKVRSGKGKMRGRKYKKNAGLIIVTAEDENIKTKSVDSKRVSNLGILDLAKGGPGRLTIYTEKAINELEDRLNNVPNKNKSKVSEKDKEGKK